MDHGARIKTLLIDMRNMGILFYIPLGILAVNSVYCYLIRNRYGIPIEIVRENYGVFPIISIAFWISCLFENLVNSEGKEMLLSMPYRSMEYGVLRVIKYTVLYIAVFYIFFVFILIMTGKGVVPESQDIYLPMLSVFFYSAFSFFIAVIVKNSLAVMVAVGILSMFMYSTRGGVSFFYIYPFQWGNPNPYFVPNAVGIALMISSVILYIAGQILFSNRDFLMK